MQKHKNGFRRAVALMMAAILSVSVLSAGITAQAVTQADINALKSQAAALSQKKAELQQKINTTANSREQAVQQKRLLEEKIEVLREEIAVSEQSIQNYGEMIAQKESELEAARAEEARYYDLFCSRVREMEETGDISYWAVLFQSSSFSDLLDRMNIISEVMEYDNGVMDALAVARQAVADAKAQLEENKAAEEEAKRGLESQKYDLQQEENQVNGIIAEINRNMAYYAASLEETNSGYSQLSSQIANAEAQYAAQLAAARRQAEAEEAARKKAAAEAAAAAAAAAAAQAQSQSRPSSGGSSSAPVVSTTSGKGGYAWPVPSSTHTSSQFGYRNCPYHGYELHGGVDISASYGAPIVASKAGVVLISTYGGSYGNYVVIAHGDGTRTLYAHMSSRACSPGASVSQGQTIGYVGSTGNSTGNHCHFEVWTNSASSSKVNPMSYF